MNYFELYELPVSLQVDKKELNTKYIALQKRFHPDFFSKSDASEQEEMLQKSSMVNRGYKVFNNEDDTLKYVLELKGLVTENEKYDLPPDFLMEMMEINETLAEPQDSEVEEMETKINQMQNQHYQSVQNIIENYNDEITTNEQLLLVKDYYYKKKYLNRILERLDGMRNIASQF
ncbi:MAG: Fe-S protein assembly co-chaperone HscB [Ginsengibacter sp.]